MLKLIGFDTSNDRMFSVGDLVDRGVDSRLCAEMVYLPWFYPVKGNHEDMMIRSIIDNNQSALGTWLSNGGIWAMSEDKTAMHDLAEALDQLPIVIVVGEHANRFNVVHAELLHSTADSGTHIPVTDQMIDDWVFDYSEEDSMIWGRTIIGNARPLSETPNRTPTKPARVIYHDQENMSLTYVGHTPVRDTVICQRQMYIDNGAVFYHRSSSHDNKLVIASPSQQVVYQYILATKELRTVPYDQIQQLA